MLDGWEINGKRVRWRELEMATVRDVVMTEHTFKVDPALPPQRKTLPSGRAVIARADNPGR
jgi:hypothetical protein